MLLRRARQPNPVRTLQGELEWTNRFISRTRPSQRFCLRDHACSCAPLFADRRAASAQVSITGVIAGTVTDGTDGVLPGAAVVLKDEGTGVQKQTVANEGGGFAFRDLSFGSYEVTVSLQGFQTALYQKVVVESGRTTDLRIRLAVGALERPSPSRGRPRCSR